MKSKAKLVIVIVVTVSLGLSACGGSQAAPSIGGVDITGVWKKDKVAPYLQLNEDGTYRLASSVPWLEKAPSEIGEFRLEGTFLTFITSDESYDCKGQSGSYEVELTEEDRLLLVLQEDACEYRVNGRPGIWSRVEP
jgi:hypothetical protein